MITVLSLCNLRSNEQIKKVDTVHAQDYGTMSARQLTFNIKDNKQRDMRIAAEMQYVLHFVLIDKLQIITSSVNCKYKNIFLLDIEGALLIDVAERMKVRISLHYVFPRYSCI